MAIAVAHQWAKRQIGELELVSLQNLRECVLGQ